MATRALPGSYLALDLVTGVAETLTLATEGEWTAVDKMDRLVMRLVEPGTFLMGGPGDSQSLVVDESPVHRVTLTRDYYLGIFEVTQGQWRRVTRFGESTDRPVADVTRERATVLLSALERRFADYAFSLPTEAEWEYACRAGGLCAEVDSWNAATADGRVQAVGLCAPNAWGLYDMCGNVWEWCQDVEAAYSANPVTDPVGPPKTGSTPLFAARGGSWRNSPLVCTASHRAFFKGDIDIVPIGLRVVCRLKSKIGTLLSSHVTTINPTERSHCE